MIRAEQYTAQRKAEWDAFVDASKNGTFLFKRAYMDYHSDRFADFSLIFCDERGRIVALLPANRVGDVVFSHQGLTYGGIVLSEKNTAAEVLEIMDCTLMFLREQGVSKLIYKQMPSIYHRCPAEEDEYALWRNNATLDVSLISTTIPLSGSLLPKVERRRNRGVKRAEAAGYRIQFDAPLEDFWQIMVDNLRSRYDVAPVHSLQEMQLLQGRFPEKIRCHVVRRPDGGVVAGAVIYECNDKVVHVQYGHANEEGKANGALDLLYLTLIDSYKRQGEHAFFDFGNSNEQRGRYLNESLIAQKEGFGGRGVVYRQWVVLTDGVCKED